MVRRLRFTPGIGSVMFLSVAAVLLLSGCGGAAQATALHSAKSAPAPTASSTPTATGYALLMPEPAGTATLTWDPGNGDTLTVDLSLAGLAPASPGSYPSAAYPAMIGAGSCQQPGGVVHKLNAVTADQYGAATSTTTIKGVTGGIPAKEWHIALGAPAGATPGAALACAPVINPTPSTTSKQTVKTVLRGMAHQQGGEGAYGKAQFSLSGSTLTVTVSMTGLAPGSHHEAHIHSGSCAKQGPVVHPLEVVVADASGNAHVVTTIHGVQSIPGDWYVNVHNGTDLKTQAGFQPIACGNVFSRS